MDMSNYKPSRRALMTVLVSGAGGAALIGGPTGISHWALSPHPLRER